jgi:hypothetical protein
VASRFDGQLRWLHKVRLYLTCAQERALVTMLRVTRELYNALLQQRRAVTYVDDAAPVLIALALPRAAVVTRPIVRNDDKSAAPRTIASGCDVPATTATSLSEAG